MRKIIESVPNFSEGRRREVVDALCAAFTSVQGVALLDCQMDPSHNRCVISVAGDPEAVPAGIVAAVGRAVELIDLREHRGVHPRMGAADVIPLIPISGVTIEECIRMSVRLAEEIAERYRIPVYLYERSARIPARQDLAFVRRGEFEGIRDEIQVNPERKPDFGPAAVHPSAGATAVGARLPLIAYNVYLGTADPKVARSIARAVRFSGGGLRHVKALGLEIKERRQAQVSMNLVNFEETPIFRAFDMVRREAERFGVPVSSSEIVGLVPQKALDSCSEHYLRLEGFHRGQILENRLAQALPDDSRNEFLSRLAAPDAAPGGGSAAALSGAMAAALGEMSAGLTKGRERFAAVERQMASLHAALTACRRLLQRLMEQDSDAYQELMNAFQLPKQSDEEKARREEAIRAAARKATEVPLRIAQAASEVLESLVILMDKGNPNAGGDVATGAQLAFAALKSSQYNIRINTSGMKDAAFVQECRIEVDNLVRKGREMLKLVDESMGG